MRMQSSQANCGPAALYNAGCALGKKLSLEECEKACKTTADGTSPRKLIAGAARLGFDIQETLKERSAAVADLWLSSVLREGRVAIVTVDADEHWVAVVGRVGRRYLVADSADNELVLSYSAGEFLQRWQHPSARRGFYALVVS